jgi:hypothetical protein
VIDQISQQQVEGKERGSEEKIVHRVKIDTAHRRDD